MVDGRIISALNVGKLEHNAAKGHLWALVCASFQPTVLVLPLHSARTTVGPQKCSGSHQLGQPWVVPHFIQLKDPRAECCEEWQAHVYLEVGKGDLPISIHGLPWHLLILCFVSLLLPLWLSYTFLHFNKHVFYTSEKGALKDPFKCQNLSNSGEMCCDIQV